MNSLQVEDVIVFRRTKYYSTNGSQCKRLCVLSDKNIGELNFLRQLDSTWAQENRLQETDQVR